jgi:hypothetical protein
MTINAFEGARRISKVIIGIIILGSLLAIWFDSPYVSITYQVPGFGITPVKVEQCGDDDAKEYLDAKSAKGKNIHAVLCFAAHEVGQTGEMLIPYAFAGNGKWWLQKKYSSEVTRYTKLVAAQFTVPFKDAMQADELWTTQRINKALEGFGLLAAGIFAFWFVTLIIGWIVRGFMGIPLGQDRRPV